MELYLVLPVLRGCSFPEVSGYLSFSGVHEGAELSYNGSLQVVELFLAEVSELSVRVCAFYDVDCRSVVFLMDCVEVIPVRVAEDGLYPVKEFLYLPLRQVVAEGDDKVLGLAVSLVD